MSQSKPMFIYLKYQCPRCHASDERLIDFEDWDSSLLRAWTEMVPGEEERVARLGPIEPEEIIDFACRVKYDGVQAVRDLADSTR